MQVAGKAVAHVERFIDIMDKGSVETVMDLIGKDLIEFKGIISQMKDPLNQYRFEQEFGADIDRAERAYAACEARLEAL